MSIAPVLPPKIAARRADPVAGAVVIPFRHRAPEPPPRSDPDQPDSDPTPEPPAAHPPATRIPTPRSTTPPVEAVRTIRSRRVPLTVARGAVRPGARVIRPATAPGKLRLTRRGRVVVAIAALLGALGVGMLSARVIQSQTGVPDSAPAVVQVQPGDTLWSIAERIAPQADTRSVVDTIIARNNIVDGVVHPGQRLVIHP
jgi:LysM domain